MSQSSGPEIDTTGNLPRPDVPRHVAPKREQSAAKRPYLETFVARLGFAGAVLLFAGLWFQRTFIAGANARDMASVALIVSAGSVQSTRPPFGGPGS